MIDLQVNGRMHRIAADPQTPLLYVLREDLQLNGAKFGCGLGQCGACTVLIDGVAAFSCVIPILLLEGKHITTVEGLGTAAHPGPMQLAFIQEQAAQCGYCIPGMMLRAQALLQVNPRPSDREIRAHLAPQLCRCGTHMRIVRAVQRAAALMRGADDPQRRQTGGNPEPAESGATHTDEILREPADKALRQRPDR